MGNFKENFKEGMEQITLTSARGLVVSVPIAEYSNRLLSASTDTVRASILSDAGRALKHRRILADFYAQTLTASQRAQVRAHAVALSRRTNILNAARDLGYGEYVNRVTAGRPVPDETWSRIMDRATDRAGYARLGVDSEYEPTPADIEFAMGDLGYITGHDASYSRRFTEPTWQITAPDGWNGQSSECAEAVA